MMLVLNYSTDRSTNNNNNNMKTNNHKDCLLYVGWQSSVNQIKTQKNLKKEEKKRNVKKYLSISFDW